LPRTCAELGSSQSWSTGTPTDSLTGDRKLSAGRRDGSGQTLFGVADGSAKNTELAAVCEPSTRSRSKDCTTTSGTLVAADTEDVGCLAVAAVAAVAIEVVVATEVAVAVVVAVIVAGEIVLIVVLSGGGPGPGRWLLLTSSMATLAGVMVGDGANESLDEAGSWSSSAAVA
jgi:hypothetical protein